MNEDRLKKLAQNLDALAEKDRRRIQFAQEIAGLRREAARELHAVCYDFVDSVNRLLSKIVLELSPPEFSLEAFRDPGVNVFQINASGRVVQIEFQAPETPTATEKYRVPYILEGELHCFNQELLDRVLIAEQRLFHCLEKNHRSWVLFDPRTHRTAPLDQERLVTFMEQLV